MLAARRRAEAEWVAYVLSALTGSEISQQKLLGEEADKEDVLAAANRRLEELLSQQRATEGTGV